MNFRKGTSFLFTSELWHEGVHFIGLVDPGKDYELAVFTKFLESLLIDSGATDDKDFIHFWVGRKTD